MKNTSSLDTEINLLDLIPQRIVEWIPGENNRVILLVPKFSAWFVQKFIPLLAGQRFRMKLDDRGSMFWQLCDGSSTVYEIAEKMKQHFGGEDESFYERIGVFVRQMIKEKYIAVEKK